MIDQAWLDNVIDLTRSWIEDQRSRYRPLARGITEAEKDLFIAYFNDELLGSARFHNLPQIEEPPWFPRVAQDLRNQGVNIDFDFTTFGGITYVDTVVLSARNRPLDKQGFNRLKFHELVHAVQYKLLGLAHFARFYVLGLQEGHFSYCLNPFEQWADALEKRFSTGEHFSAFEQVRYQLQQRGYLQ